MWTSREKNGKGERFLPPAPKKHRFPNELHPMFNENIWSCFGMTVYAKSKPKYVYFRIGGGHSAVREEAPMPQPSCQVRKLKHTNGEAVY